MADPIAAIEQAEPGYGRGDAIHRHLQAISQSSIATYPDDEGAAQQMRIEALHRARLDTDPGYPECFTCRWAQPFDNSDIWECRVNAPIPTPLSRSEQIADDVGGAAAGVLIGHEHPHARSGFGYALARPVFLHLDDDTENRQGTAFWPSVLLDEWCGQWQRYTGPPRPLS